MDDNFWDGMSDEEIERLIYQEAIKFLIENPPNIPVIKRDYDRKFNDKEDSKYILKN